MRSVERRDVVHGGVERHPQRHALGMHEVVGTGRADLDQRGRGADDTNSSAFGDSSTHSSFARSDEVAPRIAGSSCISVACLVASSSERPAGPSKRRVPFVRSLTNATAWLIASIVAW